MPHTKARRFKPQATQTHTIAWQARKADMLTVKPCVAPFGAYAYVCNEKNYKNAEWNRRIWMLFNYHLSASKHLKHILNILKPQQEVLVCKKNIDTMILNNVHTKTAFDQPLKYKYTMITRNTWACEPRKSSRSMVNPLAFWNKINKMKFTQLEPMQQFLQKDVTNNYYQQDSKQRGNINLGIINHKEIMDRTGKLILILATQTSKLLIHNNTHTIHS